ncbi:MAG: Hsp20/alpha crystallin family protein [Candidatus Nezhaarchaeales archaeon]
MSKRFRSWFEEIDELFQRLEESFFTPSWDSTRCCLEPLIDIQDRENEVVVTIDLPFVASKDDVKANVTEDTLEVIAELKRAIRWERWGASQRRFEFKTFRRLIRLPDKVNPNEAKASFKAGVLRITLPKARKLFTIKVE